ncbi:aldose epimerase family protein [Mycolicibacterium sp. A43C]
MPSPLPWAQAPGSDDGADLTPGYSPDLAVSYTLSSSGLNVTHSVTNTGNEPAPVAIGAHPFLGIGDIRSADLTLTVPADTHIDADDRLNPVGSSPVRDGQWDLRAGRPVADLDLDDSWTDLHMVDGGSTHTLRAPDGRAVSLWAYEQFGYVHAFITRRFPVSGGSATAVAHEPMIAPADAFNSGENLRWVQPEATWSASWAIRYS